jgi:hypothetical protein
MGGLCVRYGWMGERRPHSKGLSSRAEGRVKVWVDGWAVCEVWVDG